MDSSKSAPVRKNKAATEHVAKSSILAAPLPICRDRGFYFIFLVKNEFKFFTPVFFEGLK